jgi:2-polyprenyl-3-methyl-5-hydroxy-6-metoxy-1,4-benzoquinol methylase
MMLSSGSDDNAQYKERLYENQGFPALVNLVEPGHHRILDVGCGNGANMRLLAASGHDVVGITLSEVEARVVQEQGFTCQVYNIAEEDLPFAAQSFDALLFCHVLEHVAWPGIVLKRYLRLLRPGGGVYVALPNAVQFGLRWQFLWGRFCYTETGLMDHTHLRFFDFHSARQLVETAGLEIIRHFGAGFFPMGPLREWTPTFSQQVDAWASRIWPGLFAFHLVVVARLSADCSPLAE